MKTRCLFLGILYGASMFSLFSNSHGIVIPGDESSYKYSVKETSWTQNSSSPKPNAKNENLEKPKICQQSIITHINNRYASTVVTTKVVNAGNKAQEYIFSFHAPNNAFITTFVIEINGKNYTSTVLGKDEANKQFKPIGFTRASKGWETAPVRNTQQFSVPINLEALSMATLYLTYEELLMRSHGRYEHVINIFPGQVVEDLYVEVFLNETSKIIDLKVPNLRSGYEIENKNKELNPQAYISDNRQSDDVKFVKVLFMPKEEEQRKFARIMKTDVNRGFAGQFVVHYDVENNEKFGEIIVSSGYFANFFAPRGLDPLVKHVIFVLDISGSMIGKRLDQLKVAMKQMLNQLRKNDLISLIQFNSAIKVWNLELLTNVPYTAKGNIKEMKLPKPSLATPANIKKAINCVNKFEGNGGTDILSPLKAALTLVESGKNFDKIDRQPLIMFLTDGEPNVGVTTPKLIIEQVTAYNQGLKRSPISTLAFGNAADQTFLRDLALLNMGFFKHIYDAKDSELQIEDFFKAISVPVLANVNFRYSFPAVKNITITEFPLYYDGLEIIVAGQYDNNKVFKQPVVEAFSTKGALKKQVSQIYNSASKIKNLWAFLTTKQLLNKIIINKENQADDIKKIKEVCLKYSFVTPFTSMVVAKPNEKVVLGTTELIEPPNSKSGSSVDDTMKYMHG